MFHVTFRIVKPQIWKTEYACTLGEYLEALAKIPWTAAGLVAEGEAWRQFRRKLCAGEPVATAMSGDQFARFFHPPPKGRRRYGPAPQVGSRRGGGVSRPDYLRDCTAEVCERMPTCATCRRTKAPRGRSIGAAAGGSYCGPDCPGYEQLPAPGHLWPGELARMDAED